MYLFQSDIVLNLTRFEARSCIQSFFSIETFHDICHKTLRGGGGHSKSTIVAEWGGVSLKSERKRTGGGGGSSLSMPNINLLCWVDKKINSFLSFHSLIFNLKTHKRRGSLFESRSGARGDSLKRKYVEWEGVHVKRIGTNKMGKRSKIGIFDRTNFLNTFFRLFLMA